MFTGRGVGGMVAHVAALLARDTSLLGAHVEVRAVAFGAPPCVSAGIATVLAQSGLDQQHVTFFHEADVRLRLLHTAFAVQLCKLVGKDVSFEELVSHTQALLGPSASGGRRNAGALCRERNLDDGVVQKLFCLRH